MLKCLKLRLLFALELSDVAFIMLIHVKMPTISYVKHDESSMTFGHSLHFLHICCKDFIINALLEDRAINGMIVHRPSQITPF